MAEVKRFFRDFAGNGQLRLFNAETDALIAQEATPICP